MAINSKTEYALKWAADETRRFCDNYGESDATYSSIMQWQIERIEGGDVPQTFEQLENYKPEGISDMHTETEVPTEGTEAPKRRGAPLASTNGEMPDDVPTRRISGNGSTLIRGRNGEEIRTFGHGQKLADFAPRTGSALNDMGLEEFANGLVARATGSGKFRAEVRALSTSVNADGGLVVDGAIAAQFVDLARAKSQLSALGAMTVSMDKESLLIPRIASDPTISLVAENATIPTSQPTFDGVSLFARKHGCIVPVSSELLDDADGIADAIVTQLTTVMGQKFDDLCLNGNGSTDGYTGVLNDPTVGETDSIGGIHFDDLLDGISAVELLNATPNGILGHPTMWATLRKLKNSVDGDYLRPPEILSTLMLKDSTKIESDTCLVGDFSQVLMGVRNGITIATSAQAGDSFSKDQTLFRILFRGDCNLRRPWLHKLSGLTY